MNSVSPGTGGKRPVTPIGLGPLDALAVNGSASTTAIQSGNISIGAGKITYALSEVGNDRMRGRVDAAFDKVHTSVDLKSLYVGVDLMRFHPTDAHIVVDSWDAQSRDQKLGTEKAAAQREYELKHND